MLIEIVGDIVTQPLNAMQSQLGLEGIIIQHHGIDQHFQILMGKGLPDVLVSHMMADYFLQDDNSSNAVERMALYCNALADFAKSSPALLVVNTLSAPTQRIVGQMHIDQLRLVAELNAMLFECAAASPMISIADLASVLTYVGLERSINRQNALVMRMPYTRHVLPRIVEEYVKIIRERFVARKKVVLLDADNTLWGGVIGEDGIDGIRVDNQFPGIVYRLFQRQLVDLAKSGILLALVSKNNVADVKQPFDQLDMPLNWDSFSATRSNWQSKTANIIEIAEELNVGLDSMVFIDDNPFEIEQVKNTLPMVDCYQFDARQTNKALDLLYQVSDLGSWALTAEDVIKTEQYSHEAKRRAESSVATSLDEYIRSLEIRIEVGINRASQLTRISQLTNKTNQFNLTTRRYSEANIVAAMKEGHVFDFRVIDKFGDMGIVGVSIVRNTEIEAFLMSCRALGRRIEGEMLEYVVHKLVDQQLTAIYSKSAKNEMVANFYDENGFEPIAAENGVKRYRSIAGFLQSRPSRIVEVD